MASLLQLKESVERILGSNLLNSIQADNEFTIEVKSADIADICRQLRDDRATDFQQLIDLCGVDYSTYGAEGQNRAWHGDRYAVVYHLLSVHHNHRLRVRAFVKGEPPVIASITDVWPCADWFEREAFDLFGIVFEGHPDLRRILTDYGFIGHPFRKDFPLSGYVEMRYDIEKGRVVYEPVSIEPRTLVPRIIREDSFADRDS